MRQFSTVGLVRDFREVTHAAARAPVAITQYRKPRFVLMAIEDHERLAHGQDPRRAYATQDTPPELASILIPALEKLVSGPDKKDGT